MTDTSTHQLLWLRPSELAVDAPAQRDYVAADAQKIADNFDSEKLGFFEVSAREGRYYVVDGQHRRGALLILDKDEPVPCVVVEGHNVVQDAKRFLARNVETRRTNTIDAYRIAVTAREPEAVAIKEVLDAFQLTVRAGNGSNDISAVTAMRTIYRWGGAELLVRTLALVETTWGRDYAGRNGAILKAVGHILDKKGHLLDVDSFADKVRADSTPGRVLGTARSQAALTRKALWKQVVDVLVQIYNKQRTTRRIAL
jgi:hypothetical protein